MNVFQFYYVLSNKNQIHDLDQVLYSIKGVFLGHLYGTGFISTNYVSAMINSNNVMILKNPVNSIR